MSRVQGIVLTLVLAVAVPASAAVLFDVSVDQTSVGPPYPTSPTQTKLFDGSLPDPPQVGLIDTGIHNVTSVSVAAYMRARDDAGGPGLISTSAFFDVFLDAAQPAPSPATSSLFDIWLQPLTNAGQPGSIPGGGGGFAGGGGGGAYSSYFDASISVVTDGGGPRALHLHSDAPPASGQPVHFASGSSIQVVDGKLHIMANLVFDGPVNNALPLFTITMTPEPASLLLLLAGVGLVGGPATWRRRPVPRCW